MENSKTEGGIRDPQTSFALANYTVRIRPACHGELKAEGPGEPDRSTTSIFLFIQFFCPPGALEFPPCFCESIPSKPSRLGWELESKGGPGRAAEEGQGGQTDPRR